MNVHTSGRLPVSSKKAGLTGLFICKCLFCKQVGDLRRNSVQYMFNILITDLLNGAPKSIKLGLRNGRTIFE